MTKHNKDKLVGGIFTAFLFGIPLAIILGPTALAVFLATLTVGLMRKKAPAKKANKLNQTDELITVVQPITSDKK